MTFSRRALFMPLNLAVCAAVVPDGWDAEIVDENVSDEPHEPSAEGIDAVGIGAMTTQAKRAYELADAYRALWLDAGFEIAAVEIEKAPLSINTEDDYTAFCIAKEKAG